MEKQIIIYAPDYRSPPSGLGTVEVNDDVILIQDTIGASGVREGIYSHIYQLGSETEDYDLVTHEKLMSLLQNLRVTHVYDPETACDMPRADNRLLDDTFSIDLWDEVIREFLG